MVSYCFLDVVHRLHLYSRYVGVVARVNWPRSKQEIPLKQKHSVRPSIFFSFRGGDGPCDDSECSRTARGSEGLEKLHLIVSNVMKEASSLIWCGANNQARKKEEEKRERRHVGVRGRHRRTSKYLLCTHIVQTFQCRGYQRVGPRVGPSNPA